MTGQHTPWISGKAYVRLDYRDDGSADVYAVAADGQEQRLCTLDAHQVREFKESAASAMVKPDEN
jgi:hypothetical protein